MKGEFLDDLAYLVATLVEAIEVLEGKYMEEGVYEVEELSEQEVEELLRIFAEV